MEKGVGLERRVKEGGPLPHSQIFYKKFQVTLPQNFFIQNFFPSFSLLHPQPLGACLSFRDIGILSPALTRMGIEEHGEP